VDFAWLLTVRDNSHSHDLASDPFFYIIHKERHPDWALSSQIGQTHRQANLTASESNRILAVDGLRLNSKDYYNLAVSQGSRSKAELLDGLLTALEMENFHVRSAYGSLLNKAGERTAHVLQHIFFCSSDQIYLARRFASRCMIQIDATFNTNNLNLPLSVIVGVTNTGMTFPIGFAFIQSESTEAFQHILKSMDDLI
jgi:hypothetical protein